MEDFTKEDIARVVEWCDAHFSNPHQSEAQGRNNSDSEEDEEHETREEKLEKFNEECKFSSTSLVLSLIIDPMTFITLCVPQGSKGD